MKGKKNTIKNSHSRKMVTFEFVMIQNVCCVFLKVWHSRLLLCIYLRTQILIYLYCRIFEYNLAQYAYPPTLKPQASSLILVNYILSYVGTYLCKYVLDTHRYSRYWKIYEQVRTQANQSQHFHFQLIFSEISCSWLLLLW